MLRCYRHLIAIIKRQEKRAELGVPNDAKLLISVGELSVRKNHKVIVEALQKLLDNSWYIIVSKGELKEELQKIDKTGRLKLLGFRTDIVELLHTSDMFLFPSLQEGLPVALMEAIANVKHFFILLGKMFFTPYGKEFFAYPGKQIFTS